MKKWILIGLTVVGVGFAVMAGMAFTGIRANDKALAETRDGAGVVVLAVSGMT